ncbi:hypothetical protein M3Y94_01235600 [Aphelenchoides besseyi]|nr:hypothetical protein M3Y94_01235600 [Aphelenchoides besseyi]
MGNDSSKLQPSSHPAAKVQRRLSTDSARRCRTSPTLPASNSSMSCSDGFLSPNMSNCSSQLSIDGSSDMSSRSRSGSVNSERSNSLKQQKHPIPLKNRQLIQSCFQNPHEILGRKIIKRTAEKRADFRSFYSTLTAEEKEKVENEIKVLLKKSAVNIDFVDEIQRLAKEFGKKYVSYRSSGFKADYFAAVADATIIECTFLGNYKNTDQKPSLLSDNAVHPAHLTLASFSQFVEIVFTSVRNGFYNEMREMRRSSHSFSTGAACVVSRQPRHSFAASAEVSPRSKSPSNSMRRLTDQVFSPTLLVNGSDPFLHVPQY